MLRTPERPDRVANVILQPMMSYSLGNYEPDYLPLRTGEGEGGDIASPPSTLIHLLCK